MFRAVTGSCASIARIGGCRTLGRVVLNANWDAGRYHRVAQPHARWGASVLDRLELAGDEIVLDAGCGSGHVTAQLLERLPTGRVICR